MLTQTLRRLEEEDVVERIVLPTVPPTVQYKLTQKGAVLIEPYFALLEH